MYIHIYVYINPYDVLRQINHQWIHKCGSWPIDREDTETSLSIGSYAKVCPQIKDWSRIPKACAGLSDSLRMEMPSSGYNLGWCPFHIPMEKPDFGKFLWNANHGDGISSKHSRPGRLDSNDQPVLGD